MLTSRSLWFCLCIAVSSLCHSAQGQTNQFKTERALIALTFDESTILKKDGVQSVRDLSAHQHNVTIHGARPVQGVSGNALHFDGKSVLLAKSLSPLFRANQSAITISAWVRSVGPAPAQPKFVFDSGFFAGTSVNIFHDTNWVFGLPLGSGGGRVTSTAPVDTKWHHLVATWDGQWQRLYVDGVLQGTVKTKAFKLRPGVLDAQTPRIGGMAKRDARAKQRFFRGAIDEFAIWPFAASAHDVTALFASSRGGLGGAATVTANGQGAGVNFTKVTATSPVTTIAVTDDGLQLIAAHEEANQITVWDVSSGKLIATVASRSPRYVLARGDEVYVANYGHGTVSVHSRALNYRRIDEVTLPETRVTHLCAPSGTSFDGRLIATMGRKPFLIDRINDRAELLQGVFGSAFIVSQDGKQALYQEKHWGISPAGGVSIFRPGKDWFSTDRNYVTRRHVTTGYIHQTRPRPFWLSGGAVHDGEALNVIKKLGDVVLGDSTADLVYAIGGGKLRAHQLSATLPVAGEVGVQFPDSVQFHSATSDPTAFSKRYKPKKLAENVQNTFHQPVAVTFGDRLYLYVLDPIAHVLYRAEAPSFRKGPSLAAAQSVAARRSSALRVKLSGLALPGSSPPKATPKAVLNPLELKHAATHFEVTEDGQHLVVAHEQGNEVTVWDVSTGELLKTLPCPGPRTVCSRGDQVLIGLASNGSIRIYDRAQDWEPVNEVPSGGGAVEHIGAPRGAFYKNRVIVTTTSKVEGKSYVAPAVFYLDLEKEESRRLNRATKAGLSFNYRGDAVGGPSSASASGGSRTEYSITRLPDLLAENGRAGRRYFDSLSQLVQPWDAPYWFGGKRSIAIGAPFHQSFEVVQLASAVQHIVPDRRARLFYAVTDEYIAAYRPDSPDKEIGRVLHSRSKPKRTFKLPRRYGGTVFDGESIAVTHEDKTIIILRGKSGTLSRVEMPTFEGAVPAAPRVVTADQSGGGTGSFRYELYDRPVKGTFKIVEGPAGLKVSDEGVLTWTPRPTDAGSHKVRYRASVDGRFSFNNLKIEVNVREGVAHAFVATALWKRLPIEDYVTTLTMTEDGRHLILAHEAKNKLTVWDVARQKVVKTLSCPSPRYVLARGDQLYVACFGQGSIRIIERSDDWKAGGDIDAGVKNVHYLSAPRGKFFEDRILATGKNPNKAEVSVSLIDAVKKTHRIVRDRPYLSVVTVDHRGKYVLERSKSGAAAIEYAGYVLNARSTLGRGKTSSRLLEQLHDLPVWFAGNGVYTDTPPQPATVSDNVAMVSDATRLGYYMVQDHLVTAFALDAKRSRVAQRDAKPIAHDKADLQPVFSPPKAIYYRNHGATLDGELHMFRFSPRYARVYYAVMPAFALSPADPRLASGDKPGPGAVAQTDMLGDHSLAQGDYKIKKGHDDKSMLLLQGRRLRVLDAAGRKVLNDIKLPGFFNDVIDRPRHFVLSNDKWIELYDKRTEQSRRIDLSAYGKINNVTPHPDGRTLFVAVRMAGHLAEAIAGRLVFSVDEPTGHVRRLDRVYGDRLGVDRSGQRLFTSVRAARLRGIYLDLRNGHISPAYSATESLVCYDISGVRPRLSHLNRSPGFSNRRLLMSPNGLDVLYVKDRASSSGTNPGMHAFSTSDITRRTKAYNIYSKIVDADYHPTLPWLALADERRVEIVHGLTAGPVLGKVDLGVASQFKIRKMRVAVSGDHVLIGGIDEEGRAKVRAIPITLTDSERRATGLPKPQLPIVPFKSGRPDAPPPPSVTLAKLEATLSPNRRLMQPKAIADSYMDAVVVIRSGDRSGTGFFVGSSGYILTSAHILHPFENPKVTYRAKQGGRVVQRDATASVLHVDIERDLSLIKIDVPAPATIVRLESGRVSTGESVTVIGHPGAGNQILDYTMTTGLVSSSQREIGGQNYVQTSAAINPGVSGGPMFNGRGNVIGVVVAAAEGSNVGFSVPVADVRKFLQAAAGQGVR